MIFIYILFLKFVLIKEHAGIASVHFSNVKIYLLSLKKFKGVHKYCNISINIRKIIFLISELETR